MAKIAPNKRKGTLASLRRITRRVGVPLAKPQIEKEKGGPKAAQSI